MEKRTDVLLPAKTREYRNHILDSTNWDKFIPRDDDIIVDTCYKSGTTWMGQIANELVWQGEESGKPKHLGISTPWIDFSRFTDVYLERVNNAEHRRVLKSHLPLDGLRFFPQCKYLYVARGGLDVVMSWWNFYKSFTGMFELVNDAPDLQGSKLPEPPEDFHQFYKDWISKGWFDWEGDGYPFWSYTHHAATWWPYRHLPNVMFMHYNELKEDLPGMMRKIAKFLDIPILEDRWDETVHHCTFEYMKGHADDATPQLSQFFKDGAHTVIHKGTNNRWKGVMTEEEIQQYRDRMKAVLPIECVEWIDRD